MNPVQSQFDYMKKEYGIDALINGESVRVLVEEIEDFNSSDMKSIFMDIGLASQGDCITIDGVVWMLYQQDETPRKVYDKFIMKRVYHSTNFIIDEELYTTFSLFSVGSQSVNENKYISVVDGKLQVIIKENEQTKKIQVNDRIIKFQSAWQVIAVTNESKGIVNVFAEKVATSEDDDIENEIPEGLPVWNIALSLEAIELSTEDTYQLTPTVTKNEEVVSDGFIVEYTSSDDSVCMVNSDGNITAIAEGNCTITASIEGHSDVFDTIDIVVAEVAEDVIEVKIEPNVVEILKTQTQVYEVYKYLNDSVENDTFTYSLSGAESAYYEFENIDGNSFSVTSLGYSYTKLLVTCTSDVDGAVGSIEIQLKNMF